LYAGSRAASLKESLRHLGLFFSSKLDPMLEPLSLCTMSFVESVCKFSN
jgi:hypothetical protein